MAVTSRDKPVSRGRNQSGRKSGPRKMPKTLCNEREFEGLCMTCVNAKDCMFAAKASCPVIECEEFRCEGACREVPASAGRSRAAASPKRAIEIEGLCANCEDRDTCSFTRPPGGIWHCLEYR